MIGRINTHLQQNFHAQMVFRKTEKGHTKQRQERAACKCIGESSGAKRGVDICASENDILSPPGARKLSYSRHFVSQDGVRGKPKGMTYIVPKK